MSLKEDDEASDWKRIDEWDGGFGWLAYPDEKLQRASHALDGEDGQLLVDPVDFPDLDDVLADRGPVAGVVVLLNRHKRDAATIARRHDVPVYVPEFMDDVARDLDAEVERIRYGLPGTDYGVHTVIDNALWKEAMLFSDETATMVVAEAVGTTPYFVTGERRLGVHPVLRLTPPRKLGRLDPERVLVGHGEGVLEDAGSALRDALDGSRSRTPRLYAKNIREMVL
jgi:hypothetical protein